MRGKPKKIKRYSPFDDRRARRKRNLLRGTGVLLGLGLLFFAGWMLARAGLGTSDGIVDVQVPSQPAPLLQPGEGGSEESGGGEESTAQSGESSPGATTPAPTGDGSWLQLEHSQLTPNRLEKTVQELKDAGVTVAVVQLKDETGYLYYQSTQDMSAGSTRDGGFDAAAVAEALAEAGIQPAAAVYAYADTLAPKIDRSAGVQLAGGQSYLWHNGTPGAGGVPWLNPYAASAQSYISGVVNEVASLGYTIVVVDGLQFPTGPGQEQADLSGGDKNTQLANATASLASTAHEAGAFLWLRYPADMALGEDQYTAAGGSIFSFGADGYVLDMESANVDAIEVQQAAGASAAKTILQNAGNTRSEAVVLEE